MNANHVHPLFISRLLTVSFSHHTTMPPRSLFFFWGAALAGGTLLGTTFPPFRLFREYIDFQHTRTHAEGVAQTPFVPMDVGEHQQNNGKEEEFHQARHPSSSARIERELFELEPVKAMLRDPRLTVSRAWTGERYHPSLNGPNDPNGPSSPNNTSSVYTAHTLHVPGALACKPLIFSDPSSGATTAFVHVGHRASGFPALVHGGVLAALCDETLAQAAFLRLEGGTGVTARLRLEYKRPTGVQQFVVVKARVSEEGRKKVRVVGSVESVDGKTFVETDSVFVVPKKFQLERYQV